MRLKCIKLAGFKSFVNPTTINFPSNFCAIVGPNGCGKSNVIDAVRWVMGESSAHNLRSGQMAGVIFEGTTERSPVGLASVELVLDNSDKGLKGEYAGYAEISIKRKVERGGNSEYLLNGARCRRRDITELFLGTGLGPRSYSIVEQGTVSRLIESRPEELRVFIEEAAGISRYRERRRETATRIARTRENLERLADRRGELQRQLQHLERQSRAAERYRELKERLRRTEARVYALRWQALARRMEAYGRELSSLETGKEAIVARQREEEAGIERSRQQNLELVDSVSGIQNESIQLGNDITRIEQSIKHHKEGQEKLRKDLAETSSDWQQTSAELDADLRRVTQIQKDLVQVAESLAAADKREGESSRLAADAENRQRQSQQRWDDFSLAAETPRQVVEVEQAAIRQLQSNMERDRQKQEKLRGELAQLDTGPGDFASREQRAAKLAGELDDLRGRYTHAAEQVEHSTKLLEACDEELNRIRDALQQARGRKASLDALQQAALGDDDEALGSWLSRHGLSDHARLGESLRIEAGWEAAVELVLGDRLRGITVGELSEAMLRDLPRADLTLLDAAPPPMENGSGELPGLGGKLNDGAPLGELLRGVYAADDLAAALAARGKLKPGESIISAGGVWFGSGWVQVSKADREKSVVLRQSALDGLAAEISGFEERSASLIRRREACREQRAGAEKEREYCLEQLQQKTAELNRSRNGIAAERSRIEGNVQRGERISRELDELESQLGQDRARMEESEQRLRQARERMRADAGRQREYEQARKRDRQLLSELRDKAARDKDELHRLALKKNELDTMLVSTRDNMDRMALQVQRAAERIAALESGIEETNLPGKQLRQQLQEKLVQQKQVEGELQEARAIQQAEEQKLKEREKAFRELRQKYNEIVEEIGQCKLENERAAGKSEELLEWLGQSGLRPQQVLDETPEDLGVASCEDTLLKLRSRIDRIGAVNLAAAEEFRQQTERKIWLDKQNEELEKALATLEDAMGKIDTETRSRFGATMDQINHGLKNLFARLFRGGQAWLELTSDNLLDAGVSIMARPPGKKIQGIMQLSGGEKAMTAIALVFTIFQLNPSPFCMLDEVDAPLDVDNNNRFITLLREMSESVQFILVTHKTITMESANQLLGITMQEAGISRLVSVDIDEAAQLAEA